MAGKLEANGGGFAKTVTMVLIALFIIFGAGTIFVRVTKAVQNSRGIESGSASLAESRAEDEETAIVPAPPDDIPLYKGASLASARESNGAWAYEIMFPLGSLDEIRDFYIKEMADAGWQKYASGTAVSVFIKDNGQRKASFSFKYYGGKVRLRLLTSE